MRDGHADIALVAAVAENGIIGRNGRLPWRLPSEMQHFRRVTMGKPIIMGRKTFVSLKKPLDGRDNIVLTRSRDFALKGAISVESVEQALKVAQDCASARSATEMMVIGGAEIYASFLPHADKIYLTRIHAEPEGDIRFPQIDIQDWIESESTFHKHEINDDYDYTIVTLKRRNKNDQA